MIVVPGGGAPTFILLQQLRCQMSLLIIFPKVVNNVKAVCVVLLCVKVSGRGHKVEHERSPG